MSNLKSFWSYETKFSIYCVTTEESWKRLVFSLASTATEEKNTDLEAEQKAVLTLLVRNVSLFLGRHAFNAIVCLFTDGLRVKVWVTIVFLSNWIFHSQSERQP